MNYEAKNSETEGLSARVVLVVLKNHVKTVKSALERAGQLDRNSKIVPESDSHVKEVAVAETAAFGPDDVATVSEILAPQLSGTENENASSQLIHGLPEEGYIQASESAAQSVQEKMPQPQRMRIPTSIPYPSEMGDTSTGLIEENARLKSAILRDLNLEPLSPDIGLGYQITDAITLKSSAIKSPVHKALKEALLTLQESVLADMALSPEALVTAFPEGYSIYKPMLLLPHNAFASVPWKALLSKHTMTAEVFAPVWQRTAAAVGATHVAINSPIPLETSPGPSTEPEAKQNQENILRRPVNLVPIYGDFGPTPTARTISSPSTTDFERALWVTAKQNSIWQVWAPLYTMFSRGNIREKTRILKLGTVATDFDVPSAAADLYAGIGYFAFSYKKSGDERRDGIRRVVCWELNPWSVEGLRRGAEKNGWTCKIIKGDDLSQLNGAGTEVKDGVASARHSGATEVQEADFWVFQGSNEGAESNYASLCTRLGLTETLPIRHVNLGLLPTSRPSWSVAVGMLDEQRGGWIHVHENIGIKDIESRSKEIEGEIAKLAKQGKARADEIAVRVEHVEWVKMYAPGVVHCVLDVHVHRTE
ncbi:uncharacterized protein yc1106_03197 [Curvularia clavata]|uniref:tRNA(Phe) (4-demethylwyosine(37)-C(7)) aminocarboxypropyltransferase n=1 Tax=Curvularia clavata TaxID=95742 RepID=A0A9Q9DQ55_CURCL|nr:uncharacterized protein yc1106_03197 [Curvularia clavata]